MNATKKAWRGVALAVAIALGTTAALGAPAPAQAASTIAFAASSAPVISGSATAGSTLTVSTGSWTPAPTAFAFKWWSDGVAVSGATASTYAVRAADVGKQITVTITGSKAGYTALSRSSAATARVTGPASVAIPAPRVVFDDWMLDTVSGYHVYLSLDALPVEVDEPRYQLELDGSGTWQDIGGVGVGEIEAWATASPGDHLVSFRAVGTLAGRPVVGTPTPRVSHRARGYVQESTPTAVVSGSRITFAWDVREALNGWPEEGGIGYTITGDTDWTPGPAVGSVTVDVGYDKTVTFWMEFGGGADFSSWGEVTATTGHAPSATQLLTSTPAPSIIGTAKVGNILTARTSTWEPKPVTLSYQWNRNGNAIAGATDPTYTVVPADAGTQITISVTGAKAGFTSATKTSASTARVPQPIITGVAPTVSGVLKVGQMLTAKAGAWTPQPVTVTYQWKRNGVTIPGATATTYSLVGADKGATITVSTTGTKAGYPSLVKTSAGKKIA
ncbi:hypothetical protein BFL34_02845 [Clavibacter michiganensis]|uniref:Uncharacterized protein n=1 Tax=Clavibacter michiganensis TaxID=28447 RepID=A0A251Y1B2_9MICO|nr:hypothetical protein [Clavibacter michiganensis]OUE18092.1 hypothetical protein BFL34_02845 [Clavibacter michiganensis]